MRGNWSRRSNSTGQPPRTKRRIERKIMRDESLKSGNQLAAAGSAPSDSVEQLLKKSLFNAQSREQFWIEFIRAVEVRCMAEVGVYRGDFAAEILRHCGNLSRYYLIDPWRH